MKAATDRFASAILKSHQVAVEITVLSSGEQVGDPITEATVGTVTLDATAQTRGRLDLELVDDGTRGLVPTTPTSLLAPYGNELRVRRGIAYPDGTIELVGLGVFRIDSAYPNDTGQGMSIAIAARDRSAIVIDARFEEPYQVDQGTNYVTAIEDVLTDGYPAIVTDFPTTTLTTPALIAEEGGDRWQFAQDMAAALGMSLFFDGDGVCVMRPVGSVNLEPVASIVEGDGGVLVTDPNLLSAGRRWHREGNYNRVIATGENTGEAAPVRGVATDDNPLSPTYYFGPFGKVPRFFQSQFITTDDQAADAATAMLARELGTTQQVDFGTLVDPRLEPDDVVRITREAIGVDENHVLDALTVPLAADGAMTGRTRAVVVA